MGQTDAWRPGAWTRVCSRGNWLALPWEAAAAACRRLTREAARLKARYLQGMQIGPHCHIGGGLRTAYPRNIHLAAGVTVGRGVRFWSYSPRGELHIGSRAQIGRDGMLDFSGGLTIGAGALLSEQVLIYTYDHGYDPMSRPSFAPLEIGPGAWIGARAIILPLVRRIGVGAVVGAGAVVTRDVPDEHVYVGAAGRVLPKQPQGAPA